MTTLPEPEVITREHNPDDDLSPLEDRFISEVLANPKISKGEALERAGSTAKDLSRAASEMLSRPHVKRAMSVRRADLRAALGIDALTVAQEIAAMARAEVPDIFDEFGMLLPVSQWPAGARAAISSITFDNPAFTDTGIQPRIKSVKFVDKLKAYEMLQRLLDLQAPSSTSGDGDGAKTQVLVIGDMKIAFK